MKEEREAALAEGDGFYFYKFEQFSFDKASGKLSMDFDPRYEVVIEKLPSDYSGDMLTVEGKEELAANGEVTDVLADNPNRALEGATIHLTSVSDQFRKEYIVKEFGGNGYIMHVTSVVGGEGEGFYTLAYTSINSIVNAE